MLENNTVEIDGNTISLDELINTYREATSEKKSENKAQMKRRKKQAIKHPCCCLLFGSSYSYSYSGPLPVF